MLAEAAQPARGQLADRSAAAAAPSANILNSSAPPPPRPAGSLLGTTTTPSTSHDTPSPPAASHSTPPAHSAVPSTADAAVLAPSPSSQDSEIPTTSPDRRVCRICFGDDDEDDDLGRLLAPCRCRGTARYVHQECLRSWREADKLNSFYLCGQCGAKYRFRQTTLTQLLGRRYTTFFLAVVIMLLTSAVTGFLADPLMRLANEDALDPKTGELPFHYYDDVYALGDAVRETVSTTGYLLGDCTWSSPRELVRSHMRSTFFKEGVNHVKESTYESRARSTECGDRWAVRDEGEKWGQDDRARREDWAARVLLHLAKGAATAAWGWAFMCRTLRLVAVFVACAHYMRWSWARGRAVPNIPGIVWCLDADVFKWNRHKIKQARARGQLLSTRQLFSVVSTLHLVYHASRLAHRAAGALVKRTLARVEDLVLDLEDTDDGHRVKVD
ncbi:hypothetical protein JCM9279_002782 [Rhodotorula babjevae]